MIRALVDHGVGVLMISSELPEILSASDRILVMRDGAIVAELRPTPPPRRDPGHAVGHRLPSRRRPACLEGSECRPRSESLAGDACVALDGSLGAIRPAMESEHALIWIVLLVFVVVSSAIDPVFRDPRNLLNILTQSTVLACVAIGQTIVILTGGIDLSVRRW